MATQPAAVDAKKRRRRARAALILFRRRLHRLCDQFSEAEKWIDAVKSYLDPILQVSGDVLPTGAQSRLEQAMGLANDVQGNVHQACEALDGELESIIKDLSQELGLDEKVRDLLRPLTDPIASAMEASPIIKGAVFAIVALATGGAITGAILLSEGEEEIVLRDPTNVVSPSHEINVPSTDSTIDIIWTRESSAASFSLSWTQTAVDLPDTVVDLPGTAVGATSPTLANGAWYFHLRTGNSAGAWTSTVHLGPYPIQAMTASVPTPTATATPVPQTVAPAAPTVTPTPTQTPVSITPTPTAIAPVANLPPQVSPIVAEFRPEPQTTIYRVAPVDPEGGALTLTWTGTNCGTTSTADAGRTFSWFHPHVVGDPNSCSPTTNHSEVTVNLHVSDGVNAVVCTYPGSLSGVGPACVRP